MPQVRPPKCLVLLLPIFALASAMQPAGAQPYDFTAANQLLTAELPNLDGHVAVVLRQNGVELFRFQAGDIDFGTQTRLASFTKTLSAAVILSLVDDGALTLNERLGDALPQFEANGLGDPTILDCWAMRHGIDSAIAYEHDSRFTLAESVFRIGAFGFLQFTPPASQLSYDGAGMQAVGWIAESRTGVAWEGLARQRVFDRCAMPGADYGQFAPNPAVAGGARSSANETMNFAQMVLDGGWFAGQRVLSDAAIERLFTNHTRGLPVFATPWPATHPLYPYGRDPDYGFGDWVLAENPGTGHVEEVVGAGAWGSFIWLDRRRALTAVLITDVPAGSQRAMDAALGLFDIARNEVEAAQATELAVSLTEGGVQLSWQAADGATATRIYGAATPIRDIFDLRSATFLGEVHGTTALVARRPYYATTAVFEQFENPALIPEENSRLLPLAGDMNCDATVSVSDIAGFVAALTDPLQYDVQFPDCARERADVNADGVITVGDIAPFVRLLAPTEF